MTERLLVVNADDYGLATNVSHGILRAAESGVVTSTSAMAVGTAFAETVGALRDSGLAVGAHLCLVGGERPVSPPADIPSLVGGDGCFLASWRALLPRLALGRVDGDHIRRELGAQLDVLSAAGLTLGHVDTHQHVHLWPQIRAVALELAVERSIAAVRVPWSTARSPVGAGVRRLARRLARAADDQGLAHTATFAGLDEAGRLDLAYALGAVDRLADSGAPTAELCTHPGLPDEEASARLGWGAGWADDLAALVSPALRLRIRDHDFRLATYADL